MFYKCSLSIIEIKQLCRGLMQTLYMSWNGLGWTIAPQFKLATNNRIKEARLIGPYVGGDCIEFYHE